MDFKEIQEQFNKVIAYSQGYTFPIHSNALFEKWYYNKKWFIEKMNGKLIWESKEKISFSLNKKEKEERLLSFLENIAKENSCLFNFLLNNKDGFYSNKTTQEVTINKRTFPKGMKISRAFKFFEKDQEKISKWQTEMSMLLQEDKIEGTLCISVHPLDFLSLSENNYNWHTCHALDKDYKAGNLSYMVDNSTFICYLKGENKTILPNFPEDVPWNNKKWRMLLFLSYNKLVMFAGRQYPFFNRNALNAVMDALHQINIVSGNWHSWTNYYLTDISNEDMEISLEYPYARIENRLYCLHNMVLDAKNSLHYNDLLKSKYYVPYYTWASPYPKDEHGLNHFLIGGEVPCLFCEKDHVSLSESMLCNEHELTLGTNNAVVCSKCGKIIFADSPSTYVDAKGHYVCEDCLNKYYMECECCKEYYLNDEIAYVEEFNKYMCEDCRNNYEEIGENIW